jgi:hypothetical protein
MMANATVDQIVDDPCAFCDALVDELEFLLEQKESLLLRLVPIDKVLTAQSHVVDLAKYRRLASFSDVQACDADP